MDERRFQRELRELRRRRDGLARRAVLARAEYSEQRSGFKHAERLGRLTPGVQRLWLRSLLRRVAALTGQAGPDGEVEHVCLGGTVGVAHGRQ